MFFYKKEKEDSARLLNAIRSRQYNEVKQLLESGGNPNCRVKLFQSFESPLIASIRADFVELVKLLLSFGVFANEIGKDGLTALQVAPQSAASVAECNLWQRGH